MSYSFPPTSWTLLREACKDDTLGHQALKEFSTQYYYPVQAFFGVLLQNSTEDPDDHTNSFFISKFLSRRILQAADRDLGTFRHFLKQSLRNYCRDVFRKESRRRSQELYIDDESRAPLPLTDDPRQRMDTVFHEAWIRSLLQKALDAVAENCRRNGQEEHLDLFMSRYLAPSNSVVSWEILGKKYGLDQKKARSRAETVIRQLRDIIRNILIEETGSKEAAEEELATLTALLGEVE